MTGVFLSVPRYDWCAPLLHPSSCMWIMDHHSRSPKKNTSQMRCDHKILHISYKDHVVSNEEVHAKIQQAIGSQEEDLNIVKRHKLQWYGHVFHCQNHFARHSERGKKTRQTDEEVERQHQGMGRPGVCTLKNGRNWLQNHLWCPNNSLLRDRWWWRCNYEQYRFSFSYTCMNNKDLFDYFMELIRMCVCVCACGRMMNI